MSKVFRTIFGGPSKQKSESGNLAYGPISGALTPALGYTTQGGDMISKLLGGDTGALESFANSGGMKFLEEQGNRSINSNQAAKGLLNSGSTLKRLSEFNNGLHSTYLKDYMSSLFDFSRLGLGAAGAMAGAGGWSKGKGEGEKKGVLQSIAQAVAAFA